MAIELDPENDLCRVGEGFYDYGKPDHGSFIPKLWDLLGISQWPQPVYEKYPNALGKNALPADPGAADAVLRETKETNTAIPMRREIEEARAAVLEGMPEADQKAFCRRIREAHQELETNKIYGNLFLHLSDPNALTWNCLHETGLVHIGWGYDGTIDKDKTMEAENLTEDQFYEKYGQQVCRYNDVTAEDFARELMHFQSLVKHEDLQKDLQAMSELIRLAADTHDVKHMVELAHYLHDMDYFLLNYRLDKELPYIRDSSSITRYYGVLTVYS